MKDSIANISDTIRFQSDIITQNDSQNDFWFWFAIVELIIILLLLFFKSKKSNKSNKEELGEILESKNADIDMSVLMNNINSSKELYKKLSKKYHPDRYIDEQEKEIAEKLFQQITSNKRNFAVLQQLEKEALEKLAKSN
tara:strand:- start:46 stop:465 length:420 start_codon:yes stop_codon:yes gene_type:complete